LDNAAGSDRRSNPEKKQKHENPIFTKKLVMDKWCSVKLGLTHAELFGDNEEGRKNLEDFRKIKVKHHKSNKRVPKAALCDRYTLGEICDDGYRCPFSHRLPGNFTHKTGPAEEKKVDQFFDRFRTKNN